MLDSIRSEKVTITLNNHYKYTCKMQLWHAMHAN
jgi:hypothetical protein